MIKSASAKAAATAIRMALRDNGYSANYVVVQLDYKNWMRLRHGTDMGDVDVIAAQWCEVAGVRFQFDEGEP